MACSTAILSASLALSLLKNATLPSESFVLSPISLNTALAILHEGADGRTQQQLSNFLLPGCTSSDITNYYSSRSQPPRTTSGHQASNVTFKSANRFYLDTTLTLKKDYQQLVQEKYNAKVLNIDLENQTNAAREMNEFVVEATNGKIRDLFKAEAIEGHAYLINAVYFNGQWKKVFRRDKFRTKFHGHSGTRKEKFMRNIGYFRAHIDFDYNYANGTASCDQSTAVILLPYQDQTYNFLIVLPGKSSNLATLRKELNGETLLTLVKNAKEEKFEISLPKFEIESSLDAFKVLGKMGVTDITNLTKISDENLEVTNIKQKAMIEVNEKGTEAAAATAIEIAFHKDGDIPPSIIVDRPFLFGILRGEDILFLGQYV